MLQRFTFPGLRPALLRSFLGLAATGAATAPALPPNLVREFTATGYSGLWANGTPGPLAADGVFLEQYLRRRGFDENLQPAWIDDALIPTLRTFDLTAGAGVLTADEVAFNEYVNRDDEAPGVINNSPWRSPMASLQWSWGHRFFFQRYLTLRVRAGHMHARLGQEIRGVRFKVKSLVNNATIDGIATIVAISFMPGDRFYEDEYILTLDCIDLPDGDVAADCDAFPWFGVEDPDYANSSVLKTAEFTAASPNKLRGPCTRYFRKRAAGTPRSYVHAGIGTDTVSVPGWDINNMDRSQPYRTTRVAMLAAQNAANASRGGVPITNGIIEGEICIIDGTTAPFVGLNSAVAAGGVGAVIITRDPLGTRESCTVTIGSSGTGILNLNAPTNRPEAAALIIRDITLQRAAGSTNFRGNSSTGGLEVWFDNVRYDTRGIGTSLLGPQTVGFITGMQCINSLAGGALSGTSLSSSGSTQCLGLIRGYHGAQGTGGIDAHNVGWSEFETFRTLQFNAMGEGPSGMIVFALFRGPNVLTGAEYVALAMGTGGGTVRNITLGGLFEPTTDPTVDPGIRIAGDADAGANQNTDNINLRYLITTGAGSSKRFNFGYSGNGRTHSRWSMIGVVAAQGNLKSRLFHGFAETGNMALFYGVGMKGCVFLFAEANGGATTNGERSFAPQYLGLGSIRGTSLDDGIDPGIPGWEGMTRVGGVTSDGTGGGSYEPEASSILIGRVAAARRSRSHDFAGVPITGDDSAGLFLGPPA